LAYIIVPFDIKTIVLKIFQYFHIYTVRVEALKYFSSFLEVEYQQTLDNVKMRWLSLEQAISRIIEIYEGLK
jgi:ASC-1-like (ASCH) protein